METWTRRTVAGAEEALRLTDELVDVSRRFPVLGIALPATTATSTVQTELLAELPVGVEVRLLADSEATWTLKRRLPPGLDVFGRAARLWWPCPGGLELVHHPLVLLDERLHADGEPLAAWLAAHLVRGPQQVRPPVVRSLELQAVVLEVDEERAVVRLADGGTARLSARAFANAGDDASRLLRVAQTLRVRVSPSEDGQGRAVTPLWSPADARASFEAQCPVGSTVWGRVVAVRNHGALVSLLPGLVGLVHVSELAHGWVRHTEDHLTVGSVIAVRVVSHETSRVALSLLDTADRPLAPALLADGPPWLPVADGDRVAGRFELLATELPARRSVRDAPAGPLPASDAVQLLREAVSQGRKERDDLAQTLEVHQQVMAGLRTEARQLVRDLERDIAEARERVVATTGEAGTLAGSAEEALQTAREEVSRLRAALRQLTEEHAEAAASTRAAVSRAERAERSAEGSRRSAEAQAKTVEALRAELEGYAPASQRLLEAIRATWMRNTTAADRERHPWRDPVIGPQFLESLRRVEGVSLERVHVVCAEVAGGRAQQRNGLAVHPLRATDTSGSPQRQREDGALAFRASLQSRTSAARRLHFWRLPDGGVELAKIGYHDDFSM